MCASQEKGRAGRGWADAEGTLPAEKRGQPALWTVRWGLGGEEAGAQEGPSFLHVSFVHQADGEKEIF